MGQKPLTVQVRALRRAADILGGKRKLRAALHVPMASLDDWLDCRSEPPMEVFLRAVDILSMPTENTQGTPRGTAALVRGRIMARHFTGILARNRELIERSREVASGARAQSASVIRFLDAAFDRNRDHMLEGALDAAIDATGAQMGNVQLKAEDGLHIIVHRGFKAPFLEYFAHVHDARCA